MPALPPGRTDRGLGANFWLFWHDEIPDPSNAGNEIDIFEFIGYDAPMVPHISHIQTFNAHAQGTFDPKPFDDDPIGNKLLLADYSQFHTYACHWTPDFIKYYFDGNEIHRSTFFPDQMIPTRIVVDLNVSIGPQWINSTTYFPYEYEIDYVRVYKLNSGKCNAGKCDTDYLNCSPAQLQPTVYRNVTLGGGGSCTYTQPVGPSRYIWATDNITIYGDYTVPAGAELILDVAPCYEQEVYPCNSTNCVECH